MTDSHIYHH